MKNVFGFALSFALIFCFLFIANQQPKNEYKRLPKEERIQAMAEQEFEMTKDLSTNEIPRAYIHKVADQIHDKTFRSNENLIWEERGPDNFGGRTRALAVDPSDPTGNTLWAGGVAGGLWKCTNAFQDNYKWERIDSYRGNAAISSIVIDPSNHEIIYASTGEGWFNVDAYQGDGVYRSIDGGKTWNRLPATASQSFRYIQKLLISGDRIFACTRDAGVQMSNDRGETWTKSLGNGQFGFSERAGDIDLGSDGRLMATMGFSGSNDGVYSSRDNGDSWVFHDIPANPNRIELAMAPSNPNVAYILVESPSSRSVEKIYKTENGGLTWIPKISPPAIGMDFFSRNQGWYDLSIAVDPLDENRVFIGGVDLILTEDGGDTWTQISQWYGGQGIQYVHADQHSAQYLPDSPDRMVFTNDGGVYITKDATSSVPNIEWRGQDYNTLQFYACAVHPNAPNWFLTGAQDNGTHLYTSAGMNATQRVTGGDGGYCHIDRDNADIQISAFTYSSFNVTKNGWGSSQNYTKRVTNNQGNEENLGYFINPSDYDDINDQLIGSARTGEINVLDVHTGEFRLISYSALSGQRASAIKADPFDGDKVYIGTNGGKVVRIDSLNHGVNSAKQLFSTTGFIRNIDVDLNNPDRLLAVISNANAESVWVSEDAGETWNSHVGDLPGIPIRWGVFSTVNPQSVILATELGIWSTNQINGDATEWSFNSNGIIPTRVDMLDVRPFDNLIVAATYGRGTFTSNLCSDNMDNDNDGFACIDDCDDFNAMVNGDQIEIPYNGINDDCDDSTPDDDIDQDGFLAADDCDDNDATINPNADEIEGNGVDENCDGSDLLLPCGNFTSGPWDIFGDASNCFAGPINTNWSVWSNESFIVKNLKPDNSYFFEICENYDPTIFEAQLHVYYYDVTTDTRGDLISTVDSCQTDFVFAGNMPDVLIVINDKNDCNSQPNITGNGLATFGCVSSGIDVDGDGYTSEVDCDDNNDAINPGVTEIVYNGIDEDCNPNTSDDDLDGDGYLLADDCDDTNPLISPDQAEIPFNGIDDDCNPVTLDNDLDGDGYSILDDCDESNPLINPGATEIPGNGIDENCDGSDEAVATFDIATQSVTIYPNPTTGYLYIDGLIRASEITMINSSGQQIELSIETDRIDMNHLPDGIYFINIVDKQSGKQITDKIVLAN